MFEGSFINHNIVSIPNGAFNKEMAEKFIVSILNDRVQQMEQINFSVKKELQIENLKQTAGVDKDNSESINESSLIFENNEDSYTNMISYDWEKLFNNYTNSLEEDYLMEGIIFEEAVKYYREEISIDTAISECLNKINIIIAERN